MFKVNLWLNIVLFVASGLVLVVAGTPALYEQFAPPLDRAAANAATGLHGALVEDSLESLNAVALLANRPDVRALVQSGAGTPSQELLEAIGAPLSGRFGAPNFAFVVAADGRALAHAGPGAEGKSQVGGYPCFADTLTGVVRDAPLKLETRAFHLACAPIYRGDAPAGVMMLGWELGADYANALSKALGQSVVLLVADERHGDSLGGLRAAKLREVSAGHPFGDLDLHLPISLPFSMPLMVDERGRYTGRPVPLFDQERSVVAIVAVDRAPAMRSLAMTQIIIVAVTLVLGFAMLVMILLVQRSISKPMEVILDHLSGFAQGTTTGMLPEAALSGPFVRLAKQINMILKAPVSSAAGRSGLTIATPALTAPEGASGPRVAAPPAKPPPDGAGSLADFMADFERPQSGPQAPAMPPPPAEGSEEGALSSLFAAEADPLAAFRVQAKPAGAAPATPPPPPDDAFNPNATVAFQVPKELMAEANRSFDASVRTGPVAPPPMPPPSAENATVVAAIPPELLNASAKGAVPRPALDPEQVHFREIYQEFLQTRQECGEDTSDLTYERFELKLLKTKQQIMDKYQPSAVRFQVYVKQGKAALRAVPVRE